MDLNFSPEDEKFRAEVRALFEKIVPPEARETASSRNVLKRAIRERFYRPLVERGWMCPRWPKEFGGPGFTLAQQVIFEEEMGRAGAPNFDLGVWMVAPLIMEFGTEAQRTRYLPRMLRAEEMWCQGFSEPGAGSDLASLAARAEIDGDDFVVHGRKIWTSTALEADWMFVLVRTDAGAGKRQDGISFLLMDMKSPGVQVSPIHMLTDEQSFCEVALDGVRIPKANLLGELNRGWMLAKRLLSHERTQAYSGDMMRRSLASVLGLARVRDGGELRDSGVRDRAAALSMHVDAASCLGYRLLTRTLRGQPPGAETSAIKLASTETWQGICDLALEVNGPKSQIWRDPQFDPADQLAPLIAVASRSFTLAGGTSEIQRNIVADQILGMPKS